MKLFRKMLGRADTDSARKVREIVLEKYDFDITPSPEGPVFVMDPDLTMSQLREFTRDLKNGPFLIGIDVQTAIPLLIVTGKMTEAQLRRIGPDEVSLSRMIRTTVCSDAEALYMLACVRAISIKLEE